LGALLLAAALSMRRQGRRPDVDGEEGRARTSGASVVARAIEQGRRLCHLMTGFTSRHPEHVWPIVALESAFQVLAVVEVYVTLSCVSPLKPTFASAVVLESVSRVITMVFKLLPMRIGVDEAGASPFALNLGLGATTGLSLALVRKVRLLFWSAVGLVLLLRRAPAVSLLPGPAGSR
jgi:hypothetical protein